ncbi:MAG: ferredoxin reductase [Frankiales bacterium]|nr:ferredoxin reductase [Frankiales bacterium]
MVDQLRVVVVGAGLAGLRVVESLREKGSEASIVLVGEEAHEPYDRPPLSKHVLRGDREPMFLREEYESLGADLRLGVTATGLGDHVLRTGDGDIEFDHLVIATGAAPRRLPGAPGLVLRTLDDARALSPYLSPGKTLGIVGAGLIGCEVAASARTKAAEVHLVDVLDGPLIRVLGPVLSARIADLHREHGVHLHLGTGVASASSDRLALADGTVLDVDVVLEAMGVAPSVGWLEGSGLTLDNGVRCDAGGRAGDGVWAVGDVANWAGVRHEHWTSAGEQAATVAAAITGVPVTHEAIPYWWSDQYDVKLQGLGSPAADDDVVIVDVGPRQRPLAVYSRDGRLTGVVGFSAGAAVMKLRQEIADGAPVADVLAALAG